MSLDVRNNSAVFKRAEQLRRWEESDTNRQPNIPKNVQSRKIKFSSGCVFLASCMSGDKEEVLRLIDEGADIDTANVDGLTALHQACIDDNLDMVEFLVQHGSDVNRPDNEGWTPLHATASCGFSSIAQYLIESGADLAATNSDGDLAIDLSASDPMEDLLQSHIHEQGINCDDARQSEERQMLEDAKKWLRSDAAEADRPHPRTGATALHVASAKGYTKVLSLLLAGRADVDRQDNDGWTPLHAAAHWGQKDASQMLIAALADMDIVNYAGQTAIDVADPDIVRFLDDLKKNTKQAKRRPASQIRLSDNMGKTNETPPKVIRVEVKSDSKDCDGRINFLERIAETESNSDGDSDVDTESTESSHSTSMSEGLDDKQKASATSEQNQQQQQQQQHQSPPPPAPTTKDKALIEDDAPWRRSGSLRSRTQQDSMPPPPPSAEKENQAADNEVILRRTQSFESDEKFYQKYRELRARIKANSCPVLPATPNHLVSGVGGPTITAANTYSVQRSASLKDHRQLRKSSQSPPVSPPSTPSTAPTAAQIRSNPPMQLELQAPNQSPMSRSPMASPRSHHHSGDGSGGGGVVSGSGSGPIDLNDKTNNDISLGNVPAHATGEKSGGSSGGGATATATTLSTKLSPGNIFKNFFKSFVPPTRDEESETQRKAHAKRVRETRRSTQGVTLDEIKSAEELVKKKNLSNNNNSTNSENNDTTATASSTINDRVPATPIAIEHHQQKLKSTENDEKPIGGVVTSSASPTTPSQTAATDDKSPSPQLDHLTASYTIIAPRKTDVTENESGGNRDSGGDGDGDGEDHDKMSASYTISPTIGNMIANNVSFNASLPSLSRHSRGDPAAAAAAAAHATVSTDIDADNSSGETVSATISVVKEDLEGPLWSSNEKTVDGSGTSSSSNISNTIANKLPARDKRSLFDIDNASSLSLADKLRNEANKYSEAIQSNNDLSIHSDEPFYNQNKLPADNDVENMTESGNNGGSSTQKSDSTPSSPLHNAMTERRPSWRLKFDSGCKFKLEDANPAGSSSIGQQQQQLPSSSTSSTNNLAESATAALNATSNVPTIVQRRHNNGASSLSTAMTMSGVQRPISVPSTLLNTATVVTSTNTDPSTPQPPSERVKDSLTESYALRKPRSAEDKENDKENDSRSAQATQAVIQRRRRPKRRSTGVVHVDMDDIDPDRQESPVDGDEKESGSEQTSRSRLSSTASTTGKGDGKSTVAGDDTAENGELIDYKALWEASQIENGKLKSALNKKDEELGTTKATLDRFTNATTKNSLSELEKRERRALERKISEMEEELKQMEALKSENQRLKDENGAIIRVISKLSKLSK